MLNILINFFSLIITTTTGICFGIALANNPESMLAQHLTNVNPNEFVTLGAIGLVIVIIMKTISLTTIQD